MFEDCRVELLESFGNDLTVVNAARVSLHKVSEEFNDKDAKLIQYLVKHHHESPFFHPQIRFRLKMPIWMAREWFRHTIGFSRNEVSRRYVDEPPTFHLPSHLRTRAPSKKQGSNDDIHPDNDMLLEMMRTDCERVVDAYNTLLAKNVPPEQARMILPQNMMTEFIETGSLAAYARLFRLRTSPDAQHEIREVARRIGEHLSHVFPVSWKALTDELLPPASTPIAQETLVTGLPSGSYFQA